MNLTDPKLNIDLEDIRQEGESKLDQAIELGRTNPLELFKLIVEGEFDYLLEED